MVYRTARPTHPDPAPSLETNSQTEGRPRKLRGPPCRGVLCSTSRHVLARRMRSCFREPQQGYPAPRETKRKETPGTTAARQENSRSRRAQITSTLDDERCE